MQIDDVVETESSKVSSVSLPVLVGDLGLPCSAEVQRSTLTSGQNHSTAGCGHMEEALHRERRD